MAHLGGAGVDGNAVFSTFGALARFGGSLAIGLFVARSRPLSVARSRSVEGRPMPHRITDLLTRLSPRQLSALRDRLQAEIRAFAEVWREASANDKLKA